MKKTWAFDTEPARRINKHRKEFLERLLRDIRSDVDFKTALDVGCGVGVFSSCLVMWAGPAGKVINKHMSEGPWNLVEYTTLVTEDPGDWRRIGEVNSARVYADVPDQRYRQLFSEAKRLAYADVPECSYSVWGCMATPQSAIFVEDIIGPGRARSKFGSTILKLRRSMSI